jgi:hypothetical protein
VTEPEQQGGGLERRMVLRLLALWREVKGDSSFPTRAQMDESAMPELFPFCIVLDVAANPADPVAVSVGRTIASYSERTLKGLPISRFEPNTLPAEAVAYVEEVLRKGVPISRGGSFVDKQGVTILYRSIVMPLAEDGETISGLIAAANCREVASV